MQLEAMEHQHNCFLTLTFADEFLPAGGHFRTSEEWKRPLQLFLKRLRHETGPFRYYAVGEYGDRRFRQHYHLILFGVSPMQESLVAKCWPCGYIKIGTAEAASMSYVCSYVLKKMTNPKDRRLNGLPPEFATMSRRPGLGFGVVARIARAYHSVSGVAARAAVPEIPSRIRIAGYKYPIGRYIREKATQAVGFSEDERETAKILAMLTMSAKARVSPEERRATIQAQEGKFSIRKEKTL